ncbi:PREDICTED: uncharacterized protein At4g02000-like [Camelina sativa]|uniref:Uncharacterized protein At4g02000-like n=1 Tax=Camelina sativa TaxID=90675 RepID=A0ABM0VZ18_CAMSA|nr:PREDICTED: uncharacterized protein At4g02000-like [Camelina sativa]
MFPFLVNRWNLRGKAVGSDLGRGMFQFRFDLVEDLQQVLENGPYHFDQWMIILQKWEPIISKNFPSQIPLWVEIHGLPKHFWQTEMLSVIGEELGQVLQTDITPATAKVRVLLNGLQPLTKESVVEFANGEEIVVTLDYKNLKSHCHHCHHLTHETKQCPGLLTKKEASPPPPD